MENNFKPDDYNSVSPYFVVADAQGLIDLLQKIFDAEPLRKYNRPDGTIMHAEVRIDDSVIMLGSASDEYSPNQLLVHVYVKDVDAVFRRVVEAGCEVIEEPKARKNDPDKRGSFKDFAGNTWAVGTQLNNHG